MPKLLVSLVAAPLSTAAAQTLTPAAVLQLAQQNLDKAPSQARLAGEVTLQGDNRHVDITIRAVPGRNPTLRFDIRQPVTFQDNFTVLDGQQVVDYHAIANQVVIQPRSKATLNALTDAGTAWRISGAPRQEGQADCTLELLVSKTNPRPLSLNFRDADGKVIDTLNVVDFKRTSFTPKTLLSFPGDAVVIRK